MKPVILASIALAVSTTAFAFDKCADPIALQTLEEVHACQWRAHQAQMIENERIALVLSMAKAGGAGARKGVVQSATPQGVPQASVQPRHHAAKTGGTPTLVFVPTSD